MNGVRGIAADGDLALTQNQPTAMVRAREKGDPCPHAGTLQGVGSRSFLRRTSRGVAQCRPHVSVP